MNDRKFAEIRKSITGDEKSQYFLRCLEHNYGEATTTMIRDFAGLNRNEVNYRFSKLADLGLIEVTYRENPHPRRDDIKLARLTDDGEYCMDRGIASGYDSEFKMDVEDELRARIDNLEVRLDTRDERITQLNGKLEQLEASINGEESGEDQKEHPPTRKYS